MQGSRVDQTIFSNMVSYNEILYCVKLENIN